MMIKIKKNNNFFMPLFEKINNKWNSFINKKVIKSIFNFFPQNLILFILFIISIIIIAVYFMDNRYISIYEQSSFSGITDPLLVEPYKISFENINLQKNPEKLCFKFATYNRINNSDFKYAIFRNNEKIYEEDFNSSILKDGEFYCFNSLMIDSNNINEYHAEIIPLYSDSDNAISLYKDNETNKVTIKFVVKEKILSIRTVILIIFVFLFLFLNYLINNKKIKVEYFWLLISLCYILAITFIIPPLQVPDEPVHFINSYKLSQLDFSKSLYDNFSNKEIDAPSSFWCINYSNIQVQDKVSDFDSIKNCAQNADNTKISSNHVRVSTKTGYIVSSVGIKIADIFSNSPLLIFYLGRLFNMIISTLIVFFAIKISPKYKSIILSVATIPMFVQEMVSYSYDSIINSLCLLIVSISLYLIYNKKTKWVISLLVLALCGWIIADIKMIYLTLFLLLLFIPNEKFKKKYYKYILVVGIIMISYLLGRISLGLLSNSFSTNVIGMESGESNINYILSNPSKIIPIGYKTIREYGWFYIRGMFGYFGWFRYRFNDFIIISFILYLIYLVISNEFKEKKKLFKIINILGIIVTVAGTFASMYFYWSKYQLDYVDGVQGRYFIPILVPLIIMLMPKKYKIKYEEKISYWFINIMLLHYVLFLIISYY